MTARLWKPGDNTSWRPSNGLAEDEDQRYPPRTRDPGPPPGQDYDTLTAKYGRPRARSESEASGCPRKEASK